MFTFRTARAALTVAALVGGLTAVVRPTPSALAAPGDGILTVDIYRTFTELTTYNPALDVGQPGIVVTVTDPDGTSISSPTDANGQAVFNLDAAVGMDGGRYRVDAVIPASLDFLEPAHAGTGGALNTLRSLTNFVDMTGGDVEIRMAVWNPADYAQDDPTLAIATQVNAYVDDVDETRALLSIPWTARGDLDGSSGVVTLNEQVDVGATFGIAYDRHRERVFQAAFAKSFTSYGPAGQGAIYVTDLGGATTTFAVVPSAGSTAHSGGAHDDSFYGVPGTESLGGIALSENGAELYVVNLNDGNLYVYDATGATGGTPQVRGAGSEAAAGCQAGHWRPGTATFKDGVLYVGGVCSGPTAADLSVSIQRWDGADWIAAFSHPLTFSRGQIYTGNNASSPEFWHPWSFTYPPAGMLGDPGGEATRPEPWLSAFTFDREGSIIFGFRDRFADMTVDENYSHDSGGDLNKACSNGDGTWSWEGTGGCPTNPSHPSQAAGVTEFFVGDYFSDGSIFHFETAQGSIVAPLREAQLVSSTMDPISPQAFSIGLGWFNHADGQGPGHSVTNGAIINTDTTWNTTSPLPNSGFTKGNGLSGVTVLADLAPIQIGNRVWIDTDRDGIQDGDEDPVPGVIVELRDENGDFVATTTTDVNGEYYFDVAPGTTYQVVVVAENFAPGGALEGWHVTVTDAGGDDTIDSDGVQTVPLGDFTATVTTGGPGENDHTIDFGVFLPSVDIEKGDSGPEGSATPGVIVNDADTSPDGVGYDDGETREVVFTVVNDGNADLYQVTVTDQTIGGDADVVGLECTFPGDAGPTAGTFDAGDGWVVAWGASFGADPVAWGPGVEFTCTAALTLTGTGAPHVDRAEVHTSLTAGGTPGTIPTDGPSDEDDYVAFTGAIQVIKYDGNETDPTIGTGPDAWVTPTKPLPGDADTTGTAIVYLPDTVEPVRWVVTNTGQTWLTDVTLTDTTNTGPDVTDWTCDLSPFGGPTDYDFTSPWVGPFPPGASFFCQGELSLPAGVTHTDTVDVEAIVVVPVLDDDGQPVDDDQDGYPDYETDDNEPVRSDIVVTDDDPFNAQAVDPGVDIEKGDSGPEGSATPGVIVNDADTSPDGVGYTDGETREIVFEVANTGEADLFQVTVTDQTIGGNADVVALECTFPGDASPTPGAFTDGDGWIVTWTASFGADAQPWEPAQVFVCTASLTLTGTDAPHVDRSAVYTSLVPGGTPGTFPTDGPSDEDDYVAFTGAIRVIKYDGNESDPDVGDADDGWITPTKPLPGDADTTGTAIEYPPDSNQPVRWVVTNTGQTWLADVTLTDTTNTGPDVLDWTCDLSPFGGPTDYDFTNPWVGPFPPGASFFCQGTLTLPVSTAHTDTVDVEAIVVVPVLDDDGQPVDDDQDGYPDYETDDNEPVRSDIVVTDDDPFNAFTAPPPTTSTSTTTTTTVAGTDPTTTVAGTDPTTTVVTSPTTTTLVNPSPPVPTPPLTPPVTPNPTAPLPVTGGDVRIAITGALAALALGAVLISLTRRHRQTA